MVPWNRLIVGMMRVLPRRMVKTFATRYIAGEKLSDAVRVLRRLNTEKMMGTVDVLGENVTTREEAFRSGEACKNVLQAIREHGLNSNLSIKLTQFGLKIDEDFCTEQVMRILEIALQHGNFIRIDMEDSSVTDATLNLYERLRSAGFTNLGVVIQASLRRSEQDIRRLIQKRANIRLVKGIYVEPERIAFQDREEVRKNYLNLLQMLLQAKCCVGIATHDDALIEGAFRLIRELRLNPYDYEFQMLYGVRPARRDQIVKSGHRMRVYVPFGENWYAYSLRRFQENPQIARYVFQALFSRG